MRGISFIEPFFALLAPVIVIIVIIGPFIAPHSATEVDFVSRLLPPSAAHPMGTDSAGRDVLSRVLHGGQYTLLAVLAVVVASVVIGLIIGTIAALSGGIVDTLLMRVSDVGIALPALMLALGFAAALGASLQSAVIAIIITWWPRYARLTRAIVRDTTVRDWVEAAREMGVSRWRLIRRHILPELTDSLLVQITSDVAAVTLTISALSFIGVGALPPAPEWGAMISDGQSYLITAWWASMFPGLAVAVTGISFGFLGDWLANWEARR